jgi:hypothetical protein
LGTTGTNDYIGSAGNCSHSSSGGGGGGGAPPGGGAPGCITSTSGINRQMQFAIKLLF